MLKSALLLLSGNSISSLILLARNILVASLVSVEDYGVAATFAISMALVELLSNLGLHQMIVQDKDGNDPKLQAALQAFHLMRAVFSFALLFLLAPSIARFLNIPDVAWAYRVLALVPLMNGLVHFDIYRLQRKMIFLPSILHTLVPALLSLALVWPLFQRFTDYQVMLYAVIAQGLVSVVVSHLTAKRRYQLVIDPGLIRRTVAFGWPLLINNILLFSVFQGEKLIVGRELGVEALALFSMAFTLTLTPVLVVSRSTQAFFLPQLSAAKNDKNRFHYLAKVTFQAHLALALMFVIGVFLLGGPLVRILLGEKYTLAIPLLIWLAILQSLRLIKGANSTTALAQAKTENAMVSNIVRTVLLSLSWFIAISTGDIFLVILAGIFGESMSFIISLVLMRYRVGLPLRQYIPQLALFVLMIAVTAIYAWPLDLGSFTLSFSWAVSFSGIILGISLWRMKDLRSYVMHRTVTQGLS